MDLTFTFCLIPTSHARGASWSGPNQLASGDEQRKKQGNVCVAAQQDAGPGTVGNERLALAAEVSMGRLSVRTEYRATPVQQMLAASGRA